MGLARAEEWILGSRLSRGLPEDDTQRENKRRAFTSVTPPLELWSTDRLLLRRSLGAYDDPIYAGCAAAGPAGPFSGAAGAVMG